MDNNKANKVMYTLMAVCLYIVLSVGLGLIVSLLIWKADTGCNLVYWITKGIICFFVLLYSLLIVFGKKDAGVGAIQIMFTLIVSFLPIICRAFYMIPVAGKYISIILAFIGIVLYLITMLGLGFYATDINANSDNKKQ